VSDQLLLLPQTTPEVRREAISLDRLDGFEYAQPSRELRELIHRLGLLQPIVVAATRGGRYQVIEGRRRAKAVHLLAEEGDWPAGTIDALVLRGADARLRVVRGGLTLALHATRSQSPASELQAIETILQAAGEDHQASTVKEIAAQTGMPVQTVRRRLRLRSLSPGLRRAFDAGQIPASVAEAAARLPAEQQALLEDRLAASERLTLAAVRDATRGQAQASGDQLPEALFADRAAAWQTTVRGHLEAAIQALPSAENDSLLARALAAAVEQCERA
jgi:ParB-like chromosome segregation protein Spo0J